MEDQRERLEYETPRKWLRVTFDLTSGKTVVVTTPATDAYISAEETAAELKSIWTEAQAFSIVNHSFRCDSIAHIQVEEMP